MGIFLKAYDEKNIRSLSEYIDYLEDNGFQEIIEQRYFYDFWIVMHQRSPVAQTAKNEDGDRTIFGEALSLLGPRKLRVMEGSCAIHKVERYSITDMIMELEEAEDGIF